MRLKGNLIFLFVAAIWGAAFAVQRVAAQSIGPFLFNAARFLLAAVVLLPFLRKNLLKVEKSSLSWMSLAGILLFAASALQQSGMKWTTAANAAFITTMYVIFVPLLLVLFWKQRLPWVNWIAVLLAIAGLKLLSSPNGLHLAPGDGLELISSVIWALHVILVSKIVNRIDAVQFSIGQYLVCGLLNLVTALFFDMHTAPGLLSAGWTVFYGGVISVGLGYTLQVVGQKYSPPTDAALIMSSESLFACLAGFIFLKETLQPAQLAGCGLILAAIFIVQFLGNRQNSPKTKTPVTSPGVE